MFFHSILQDIRIGLRVLFKEKTFSILAVTVLALGICGATTQFAIVNAAALRGFSFPDPEQLVSIGLVDPQADPNQQNGGAGFVPSPLDYEDIRAAQQSYSMMAAYLSNGTANVTYRGAPQRYNGAYVTADFFRIIGVAPVLGREITADDDRPGAEKVALLSDEIWRRDFGGDPNVVGQAIRINGKPATVIGVMPPQFKFPQNDQLWVPLYNEYPVQPRGTPDPMSPFRKIVARLKPGVSLDEANAEAVEIARRLAKDHPKTNGHLASARVLPLRHVPMGPFTGPQIRRTMYAMLGAVALVLVIACVNVMNMQFGRAALRAKELAIRGALGATRGRLVRQMLTESLMIAVVGTAIGVLLAHWSLDLITGYMQSLPNPPPYWLVFSIDSTVLLFTVGITLVATIASGLIPALLSSRQNPAEVMKAGGRGNTSPLVNVLTRAMVITQVALSAALLVAATFQVKSIRNQTTLDYGYDEDAVYSARMALMEGDYPGTEARQQFFVKALRGLRANPEFTGAALSNRQRMTFGTSGRYEVDGKTYVTDRDRPQGNSEAVSDGYFDLLGLKIIEGRDFTIEDSDARQPVAIVNSSFARKYWGNESPLGRRIRQFNPAQQEEWRTIVGLVPDTLMQGPMNQQADHAGFYIPLLGTSPAPQYVTVLVRPHRGQRAETLGPALGRAIAQVDANLPVYLGGTPARHHDDVLGNNRLIATLFTIFGIGAVVLAAVGLYGVMSFSVNQRMQEFGIRMALGADTARIMRQVMRQGAVQLGIGLTLGIGAAILLLGVFGKQTLQNFLFKVNTLDPTIYIAVAALLTAVAALSCFVPARRATRVDPMVALRAE
jgi:putative ABC transport system permease protein